jgi:predicted nucleic acid-binding protein
LTFFVDANVIVYAATEGQYRSSCLRILEAVANGDADGRTSPAVLEEVWHVERSGRAGPLDASRHGPTRYSRRCSRSPTKRSDSHWLCASASSVPPIGSTSGRVDRRGSTPS